MAVAELVLLSHLHERPDRPQRVLLDPMGGLVIRRKIENGQPELIHGRPRPTLWLNGDDESENKYCLSRHHAEMGWDPERRAWMLYDGKRGAGRSTSKPSVNGSAIDGTLVPLGAALPLVPGNEITFGVPHLVGEAKKQRKLGEFIYTFRLGAVQQVPEAGDTPSRAKKARIRPPTSAGEQSHALGHALGLRPSAAGSSSTPHEEASQVEASQVDQDEGGGSSTNTERDGSVLLREAVAVPGCESILVGSTARRPAALSGAVAELVSVSCIGGGLQQSQSQSQGPSQSADQCLAHTYDAATAAYMASPTARLLVLTMRSLGLQVPPATATRDVAAIVEGGSRPAAECLWAVAALRRRAALSDAATPPHLQKPALRVMDALLGSIGGAIRQAAARPSHQHAALLEDPPTEDDAVVARLALLSNLHVEAGPDCTPTKVQVRAAFKVFDAVTSSVAGGRRAMPMLVQSATSLAVRILSLAPNAALRHMSKCLDAAAEAAALESAHAVPSLKALDELLTTLGDLATDNRPCHDLLARMINVSTCLAPPRFVTAVGAASCPPPSTVDASLREALAVLWQRPAPKSAPLASPAHPSGRTGPPASTPAITIAERLEWEQLLLVTSHTLRFLARDCQGLLNDQHSRRCAQAAIADLCACYETAVGRHGLGLGRGRGPAASRPRRQKRRLTEKTEPEHPESSCYYTSLLTGAELLGITCIVHAASR
jgi:hypothetical protein